MDNLAMRLDVDSSKGILDSVITWQLVGNLKIFRKSFDAQCFSCSKWKVILNKPGSEVF